MLQLRNIKKVYGEKGEEQVEALKGISVEFRENEFVSILGQSGCGKTTLLNIIGGLDRYTSGDLIINGRSTKEYKDRDWDTYRNHSIGFVFQSYNLIPHQSILSNVELALTLAGASKAERRKRATEALKTVGLGDKIHKKPTELSGGQMQRVAIARAIVGNPDILLADEPTGALDSQTSIQIMDLLKEIAKDRLVIMVTHNPELAEKYSTRIIKLLDGKIVADSDPYSSTKTEVDKAKEKAEKPKKTYMKFTTALSLSYKNLLTKKGRTILTAFAGSIGIIGIALIMSLSNGMQEYITKTQRETLSEYPISIDASTMDLSSILSARRNTIEENQDSENVTVEEGKIASKDDVSNNITLAVQNSIIKNNLAKFKEYLDNNEEIKNYSSAIQYSYDIDLQIYDSNTDGGIVQINPNQISLSTKDSNNDNTSSNREMSMMSMSTSSNEADVFSELIDSKTLLNSQYDILAGRMPEKYNEVVLVVDENSQIPDTVLYALNYKNRDDLEDIKDKIADGEDVNIETTTYSYEDFVGKKYKLVLAADYYQKEGDVWTDKSDDILYLKDLIKNGDDIEIVGVLKVNDEATTGKSGIIGYTHELTEYVINKANESEVVKAQLEDKETNILTGISFDTDSYVDSLSYEELKQMVMAQMGETNAQMSAMIANMSEQELRDTVKNQMADSSTVEDNLQAMGYIDLNTPSSINIYPKDFESKESIQDIIEQYNQEKKDNGEEEYVISYTDYVGLMMSSITSIINIITYVLIAFVAISLVVSSIMIAIITYISVLERTKEIGILRSIGASKKDVSRVFNTETVIEGLIAGVLGVGITLLLDIPINAIIKANFNVSGIAALPVWGGIGLIALSVVLTVIAGVIPSRMAAKKDPAVALRTE